MAEIEPFLETFSLIALVAVIPVAFVSFFFIVFARTRRTYWISIGLFVVPILLVLWLAELSGLSVFPSVSTPRDPSLVDNSIPDMLGMLPGSQLLLIALAALIWVGGGYVLFWKHCRRVGKSWWTALNPLDPPMKDFNAKEWSAAGLLLVLSMFFGWLALAMGNP